MMIIVLLDMATRGGIDTLRRGPHSIRLICCIIKRYIAVSQRRMDFAAEAHLYKTVAPNKFMPIMGENGFQMLQLFRQTGKLRLHQKKCR